MEKINLENNVITWFEIAVQNLDRAQQFYESILEISMIKRVDGEEEAAFFPFDPKVPQAKSNRVTGVLSQSKKNKPSTNGTMVYINANPNIQNVLHKVEKCGGKIELGKTKIETGSKDVDAGYIAIIIDSEGNRVGLFSVE
ncbi:VOC family protein [Flammeovirga kamogawensis]|uniref:VOC family protein n=1 Tax=Flammeovirga kamogawensis TaxID=373891 RepID=A0ABX8H4Q7_9BACT|nr:VOC family protein [Flammeovirga kamogawensis]MBB6461812.1 hypothetical protein [Flammeovirga kamogawensis]QWG10728.1 VOC family protein [Flammeovirga kamogawensis]TRX63830.1 VOC family protein [Flammeovirga kamogawensis]